MSWTKEMLLPGAKIVNSFENGSTNPEKLVTLHLEFWIPQFAV